MGVICGWSPVWVAVSFRLFFRPGCACGFFSLASEVLLLGYIQWRYRVFGVGPDPHVVDT